MRPAVPDNQRGAAEGLDDAATQLLAVGCADPTLVGPELRLRCLRVVERLGSVGARPRRDLSPPGEPALSKAVDAAISALARLPPELRVLAAVSDALDVASAVRALLR